VTELPVGWAETSLGDATEATRPICYGVLKPGPFDPDGVLLLRIQDLAGNVVAREGVHRITTELDLEFARSKLAGGEVLLSIQGTVGRVAIVPNDMTGANISRTLAVIAPDERLFRPFLRYYLELLRNRRAYETGGTTRASLNISTIRQMRVPLPPVNEQRRIVAAIEEHLSRLDAADSSLASACRRVGVEQRAVLFAALAEAGMPTVPASSLAAVSIGGVWGKEPGGGEVDVNVFRVTEFREDGVIDPTTAARRSVTRKQLASRQLRAGDLLIEKSGGGPDRPVGRVALVPEHDGPAVCSNFVQFLRPDSSAVDPVFLFRWLQRRYLDGSAMAYQTASTNIRNLKTPDYLELLVPVPPLENQRRIVTRIDEQLSASDALRAAIERAQRRSASLRRAVLERAFRGELVPQDPDDEPASVLLDRIGTERPAAPAPPRLRRVGA
jgi:type I restriction enzyme S subunit